MSKESISGFSVGGLVFIPFISVGIWLFCDAVRNYGATSVPSEVLSYLDVLSICSIVVAVLMQLGLIPYSLYLIAVNFQKASALHWLSIICSLAFFGFCFSLAAAWHVPVHAPPNRHQDITENHRSGAQLCIQADCGPAFSPKSNYRAATA